MAQKLFHFFTFAIGKVKKLTLFIPQNASKITVFSPFFTFKNTAETTFGVILGYF
jgi:hypothetical protein